MLGGRGAQRQQPSATAATPDEDRSGCQAGEQDGGTAGSDPGVGQALAHLGSSGDTAAKAHPGVHGVDRGRHQPGGGLNRLRGERRKGALQLPVRFELAPAVVTRAQVGVQGAGSGAAGLIGRASCRERV